jgi:outer membrane protein OmpA-like peptidoglycan-associated protein
MKNKYYIAIFILLSSISLFAQESKVEKANEEFQDLAFIDARKAYLKVAEDGYRSADMLMKLGDSYYFTADYENAAKWYGALREISQDMSPEYLYRYALSLKSSKNYLASDKIMEEFYASKGEDYRANLFLNERNYLSEIEQQSGRFELINVGFNSDLSDFAPAFNKGSLVFASNRSKRGATKNIHEWNNQPFLDIYNVLDVSSSETNKLSKNINSKYHESTATFSSDGQTMYFTRNNYTKKKFKKDNEGTNRLKLYRSIWSNGEWSTAEELPFNSDEYSVAHPALSKDDSTLYFASDMPGGKGQSDLYKVSIEDSGFGEPVSLGDKINTEGRETFPFISEDDKLYFASDGHIGLGGLDVFVTDITEEDFGEVYNIGRPVNSPQDDFTFIINSTTGIGYFASNRDGGVGDDDIYSFKSIKPLITKCNQSVSGTVRDENSSEIIAGATVYLLNDTNDIISETTSAADGSFTFELECAMQYCLRSIKEGYTTAEKCFATTSELDKVNNKTLFMKSGKDLGITAAPIGSDLFKLLGLNPIYFDLDKSEIRPDAAIELRKVLAVMLEYPSIKIDVRSHTDSRARDAYNLDLSNRRALSTINWLVTNGVSRDRITGKGYGETQLLNRCDDGVSCSEVEHQVNRRSEFIIVEK